MLHVARTRVAAISSSAFYGRYLLLRMFASDKHKVMLRWAAVVMVMKCALVARAEPLARPVVYFQCRNNTCTPIQALPKEGAVDVVVLNTPVAPTLQSTRRIPMLKCTNDPDSWCAANVPVGNLQVEAVTLPDLGDVPVASPEQVGEVREAPRELIATLQDGVITTKLIGSDVKTVTAVQGMPREADLDDDLDPFADVVLVGSATGYHCTGILIAASAVLTAAHCLDATRVAFGNTVTDGVAVSVTTSARHPTADVAILRLEHPAAITVRPRRRSVSVPPPLGVVRILGFGVVNPLRLDTFGKKRRLDVAIDGWGCDSTRASGLGCDARTELLLRGGRGNDTCYGDSGGPMFERTPDGWRLLGITSRGTRPKRILCGEGGIYSRVDVIDAWIEEALK